MFEFIFPKATNEAADAALTTPESAARSATQKQQAIEQAHSLQADEAALVDFILHCPFADARLIAAEHVSSPPLLEQVWQATRNTDRRVARLMHGRLDEIRQRALSRQQAAQGIEVAQRLLTEARLLANQVVDLDHAWHTITLVADDQVAEFAAVRAQLGARLESQASLQHEVLEILARLRVQLEEPEPDAVLVNAMLSQSAAAMARHRAAHEAISLPAHLLTDFTQLHEALEHRLATPVEQVVPEAPPPVKTKRVVVQEDPANRKQFDETLAGLETSLQEGALQAAAEFDRILRTPALFALRLNESQNNQLANARAELARLQGWARWGGNVSREELLKAAEDMPAKAFPPAELAKKVGSLRERWKSLDATAGPASKDLWQRFDAACTAAYAPAAAHFKKLSQERDANHAKAVALIAEVRAFVAALPAQEAIDWKKLAQFDAHISQAWHRLGQMERKDKKQLDGEFAKALRALTAPLAQRRAEEVAKREALIVEAANLNPNQRGALETLRALQERWQTHAKFLPLERKVEQALWQKFRAACDAAFAARKEVAVAADAGRREHQQAKEALCAQLEAGLGLPENEIGKLQREVKDAWNKIGQVPRNAEKQIEQRFQTANAQLQKRLELARHAASQAQAHALLDKLRLCQQAESARMAQTEPDAALAATWAALPALAPAFERGLRGRFEAALNADAAYAQLLTKNQPLLARELLRMEIVLHLDSPAELARERLQLQVEVLQSSLKAGQKPPGAEAQLISLCSLAAVTPPREIQRLERMIELSTQKK